jgi:hypothetical protein
MRVEHVFEHAFEDVVKPLEEAGVIDDARRIRVTEANAHLLLVTHGVLYSTRPTSLRDQAAC